MPPVVSPLISVALGGALGASLRYLVGLAVVFPAGTLTVNVLGSFLIGILAPLLASRAGFAPFLITGVLGGFTTFSAFSLDTMRLIEQGRPSLAAGYVAASVFLSLAACALGVWLAHKTAA